MPGRAPWSTPGTRGETHTIATQERPELEVVEMEGTDTVAAGGKESYELYAPEGEIYKLVSMRLRADVPDAASTGLHRFNLKNGDGNAAVGLTEGNSDHTEKVWFHYSHWRDANNGPLPETEPAILEAIRAARATPSEPLILDYTNDLDVDQPNNREVVFFFEVSSYG